MNTEIPKKNGLSSAFAQRQANIMASLQNRMDVAAANHDQHLLELLTHERFQLEYHWRDISPPPHRPPNAIRLWQHITQTFISRRKLSLERRITPKGEEWWRVADPRSGKTFNAESLGVAMQWIEQNRLGH
ncbi:hypothetical protein [Acaryochloris sp. CCMEE 5410]|uniref:hypothetical protein n=1 Tax=Acaryochloris sp. CCMEE 5410 TaxID=310037 RepID=UPI0002484CB0|nr:hypothetical protein [Acaryochloris sp. CCMEE 5410]KAI9132769.1 hypothetical protein ON05_005020 [Acaryochloris sp. CCMEE 5410]